MLRGIGYVDTSIKYLFIDGAYLDVIIKRYSDKFYPNGNANFDYAKLGLEFTKVFYYHAPPTDDRKTEVELKPDLEAYDRHIASLQLPGWHVFHGKRTRSYRIGNKQKQVDVQIAVELLTHSFKRNMHSATLLAGDQDFVPVVDAVVKEGMQLTVWDDLISNSSELREAADDRRVFDPWAFNELRRLTAQAPACRLPTKFLSPDPVPSAFVPIEEGVSTYGKRFVMCRTDRTDTPFAICPQERDVGGNYRVYSDGDKTFLRNFIHQLHEPLKWNKCETG